MGPNPPKSAVHLQPSGKPPLYYFSIERDAQPHEMRISRYASHDESQHIKARCFYSTKKKIAEGASGCVYAARSHKGEPVAVKIVEEVSTDIITHDTICRGNIKMRHVSNALEEARLLHLSSTNPAVIGFQCVGYALTESNDQWTVSIVMILELGTHLTLNDYFPLHCLNKSILTSTDEDFSKRHESLRDSITSFQHSDGALESVGFPPYVPLLALSARVLEAAIDLHRQSIVHRDIKPENFVFCRLQDIDINPKDPEIPLYSVFHERYSIEKLLLAHDEDVDTNVVEASSEVRMHTLKLIDFGSAVKCSYTTRETSIAGTPQYASPELAKAVLTKANQNGHFCTKRELIQNDIWSVGVTLLEMMLGRCHSGLIEGIMHASNKPVASGKQTKETDKAILKEISALSHSKIEQFVFKSASESVKAFEYSAYSHSSESILPDKWIRAVLSLVNPVAGRRGTLRSVHVVCRRLLMDAQADHARSARISKNPRSLSRETEKTGETGDFTQDIYSESIDLPSAHESFEMKDASSTHSTNWDSPVKIPTQSAPLSTSNHDSITAYIAQDSVDIIRSSVGSSKRVVSPAQSTNLRELDIEPVSTIFREAVIPTQETTEKANHEESITESEALYQIMNPFEFFVPKETMSEDTSVQQENVVHGRYNAMSSTHVAHAQDANLTEGSSSFNMSRPTLAEIAGLGDDSAQTTVSIHDEKYCALELTSLWGISPKMKRNAFTDEIDTPVTPKPERLLSSEIYETYSRIPVVKRYSTEWVRSKVNAIYGDDQREHKYMKTQMSEEPPSLVHSFLHDSGNWRTSQEAVSHRGEQLMSVRSDNPTKKDAQADPLDDLIEQSPWVYIPTRRSQIPGFSSTDDRFASPTEPRACNEAALQETPVAVAKPREQLIQRSPSPQGTPSMSRMFSSTIMYVTPRLRRLEGIPDEDSWVIENSS